MTQYLILHKVRGEPSFDCAEMMEVGDEAWWITNSGYRAYPYKFWELTDICARDDHMYRSVTNFRCSIPDDWPDHFEIREPPPANKISDIAGLIRGLMPKVKVYRRF